MKVLDSTFLIDLLRGDKGALKIADSKELLFTTQINKYEIIRGLYLREMSQSKQIQVMDIFNTVKVLELDDHATIISAKISSELIKKGETISDCDCLTAGIAISNNINTIVTKNIKHFKKIKELKIESY